MFEQKPAGAYPLGAIANAQSHCQQLPHTYLFSRFAQADSNLDLQGFAKGLIVEAGEKVSAAWEAISAGPAQQEAAARSIRMEIGQAHTLGQYAGLLFGNPDRFLGDLAANLEVRASLARLQESVAEGKPAPIRQAVRQVMERFRPYQERIGFVGLHGPAGDPIE